MREIDGASHFSVTFLKHFESNFQLIWVKLTTTSRVPLEFIFIDIENFFHPFTRKGQAKLLVV